MYLNISQLLSEYKLSNEYLQDKGYISYFLKISILILFSPCKAYCKLHRHRKTFANRITPSISNMLGKYMTQILKRQVYVFDKKVVKMYTSNNRNLPVKVVYC